MSFGQFRRHGRILERQYSIYSLGPCVTLQVFEGEFAEWKRNPDFGRILSVTEMKRIVATYCQNNRNETRMAQRVTDWQKQAAAEAAAEAAKEAAAAIALQRTARRMGRAPVTPCSETEADDTSSSDEEGQD